MSRIVVLLAVLVAMSTTEVRAESSTPAADQEGQRTELRRILAKQRGINLARFHNYRVKGVYPHNSYEPGLLNVWIDRDGHLCAVATLMKTAGLDELVEKVGREQNFVRVADLKDGPLIDWVLTSGLTQEEIVMIQAPTQADIDEMEWQERRAKRQLARRLAREDERLADKYAATERALKQTIMSDAGLDLAVSRLLSNPKLAATVLAQGRVARK